MVPLILGNYYFIAAADETTSRKAWQAYLGRTASLKIGFDQDVPVTPLES